MPRLKCLTYRQSIAYQLSLHQYLSNNRPPNRSHSICQQARPPRCPSPPGPGVRPTQSPTYNNPFKPHNPRPCTHSRSEQGTRHPATRPGTATAMAHLPLLVMPREDHTFLFRTGRPVPVATTTSVIFVATAIVMTIVASFTVVIVLTVTLNTTIDIGVTEFRYFPATRFCCSQDGDSRPDPGSLPSSCSHKPPTRMLSQIHFGCTCIL